jgi:hypothetical protein
VKGAVPPFAPLPVHPRLPLAIRRKPVAAQWLPGQSADIATPSTQEPSMQDLNTATADTDLHTLAKKRVETKMAFLVHLMVFVAVNCGLYLLSAVKGGGSWQVFPLWGWGLGLAIHGLVTLLSLQGQGLRQRLMDAELKSLREQGLGR